MGNTIFRPSGRLGSLLHAHEESWVGRILAEEGMAKKGDEFELIYLRKSQAEREREERLAKEEEQK